MDVKVKGWLVVALLLGTLTYALAEELTLTTYYPSPRGVYQELRTQGDVAIGKLDPPGARLEIVGGGVTSATTALRIQNADGTPLMEVKNDGTVGIGTATPGQKLDVAGNINATGNITAGAMITSGAVTAGTLNTSGAITAPSYIDRDDPRYFLDPNGTSRLNYGDWDNVYSRGWMQSPIFYDANNPGYFLDPNGTSRLNFGDFDNVHAYGAMWGNGWVVSGMNGRNFFRDVEGAGNLRVGAAWGIPGIYSESADVVVGSATGTVWLGAPGPQGVVRGATFGFGGAYTNFSGGCFRANAFTGDCSCPPGFGDSEQISVGTVAIHLCVR